MLKSYEVLGYPSECTGGNGQRDRRTRETVFKKVERVKSLKKKKRR